MTCASAAAHLLHSFSVLNANGPAQHATIGCAYPRPHVPGRHPNTGALCICLAIEPHSGAHVLLLVAHAAAHGAAHVRADVPAVGLYVPSCSQPHEHARC